MTPFYKGLKREGNFNFSVAFQSLPAEMFMF